MHISLIFILALIAVGCTNAVDGESCTEGDRRPIEGHGVCDDPPRSGECVCAMGEWDCRYECPLDCPDISPASGSACSVPGDIDCTYLNGGNALEHVACHDNRWRNCGNIKCSDAVCPPCENGEICVQHIDGDCFTGAPTCKPVGPACMDSATTTELGTCTPECSNVCAEPYQCANPIPACGIEAPQAVICYGS